MEMAMIGLGKMGAGMARRLLKGGHRVVGFDLNEEAIRSTETEGVEITRTMEDVAGKLNPPRVVWIMVPAGDPVEKTANSLSGILSPGDIIIDGGNSNFRDSLRRARGLEEKGIGFIDVGVSGGVRGTDEGYCLMVGGKSDTVEKIRPILEALAPAPDRGWGRVGPVGAGHFVKMVHNGIEYGLMEAYAEGFELMKRNKEFGLDLSAVAEIWRSGSVIRSWLLDLAAAALSENPALEGIGASIHDSGEGRWMVSEAIQLGCAVPVISLALQSRFRSRDKNRFGARLITALRDEFGGHGINPKEGR